MSDEGEEEAEQSSLIQCWFSACPLRFREFCQKCLRPLEVVVFSMLLPLAMCADMWVILIESTGLRKPSSRYLALFLTTVSAVAFLLCACWDGSFWSHPSAWVFKLINPPSDDFVLSLRVEIGSPVSLCYNLVMCIVGAAFCIAALMSILLATAARAIISMPFSAFSAAMLILYWSSAEAQ